MRKRVSGVQSLIITPFTKDGSELDETSLRRALDHAIRGGVHGVVVAGKIGEFAALTMPERRRVMEIAADHVAGRVQVGVGSTKVTAADGLTIGRWASELGLDYVMAAPPTDGDVKPYYRQLASIIPVMMYDQGISGEVPVHEVIAPLVRELEGIAAVKVSGLPEKILELKRVVDVPVLCGWDIMSLMGYELGADGVTSATAGLMPEMELALWEHMTQGRLSEGRKTFYEALPVVLWTTDETFAYSACKYLLHWQGVLGWPTVREPEAIPLSEHRQAELRYAIDRIGLAPVAH